MGNERISLAVKGMGTRKKSSRIQRPEEMASDDELLLRIGQRDLAAFEIFYQRHSKAMFKVACYITHDRQLAEDAVQEAVLVIFDSARTYVPGNGRGWILSIVAHKGSMIVNRISNQQKRVEKLKERGDVKNKQRLDSAAERDESRDILQTLLGELPMRDRQIVSLYYVAGLSQHQIARKLSISQRTVGYRVAKVVAFLKEGCTRAGLAAVPLSGDVVMACLNDSGFPHPTGLDTRMLDAARSVCDQHTVAISSVKGGTLLWMFMGAAVLASVAVGFSVSKSTASGKDSVAKNVMVSAENLKEFEWSFQDGVPQGFESLFGAWRWERDAQGKGGLVAPRFLTRGGLRLPVSNLKTPFAIEVSFRPIRGTVNTALAWFNAKEVGAYRFHRFKLIDEVKFDAGLMTERYVFFDNRAVRYADGRPIGRYTFGDSRDALYFRAQNVALHSISYHALDAAEERAHIDVFSGQVSTKYEEQHIAALPWKEVPAPPSISGGGRAPYVDLLAARWQPARLLPSERTVSKKTLVLPDNPSASISWDPREAQIITRNLAGKVRRELASPSNHFIFTVPVPKGFRDGVMCEFLFRNTHGVTVRSQGKFPTSTRVDWEVEGQEIPSRIWRMDGGKILNIKSLLRVRVYLVDRFLMVEIAGKTPYLCELRDALDYKKGNLKFRIAHAGLIGVNWQAVDANRLPKALRDLRWLPLKAGADKVELQNESSLSSLWAKFRPVQP